MYRDNLSYHRNWDSKTLSSRGSYIVLVNSQKAKTFSTPIVSSSSVEDASHALPPFQWSTQDPRARKSRRCRRSNYQIVRHFTRVKREAPEAAGERGKGIRCEDEPPTKKRGVLRGVGGVKMKMRRYGNWKIWDAIQWKEKEKKIRFLKFILFFFNLSSLIIEIVETW